MDTPTVHNSRTTDKDWSDYNISWVHSSPSTSFGAVTNDYLEHDDTPFNWDADGYPCDGSLPSFFNDVFQLQWPSFESETQDSVSMRQGEMKMEEENQEAVIREVFFPDNNVQTPSPSIGSNSSSSPPLTQQRKGGKVRKVIQKPKRKYLYEFDLNEVSDKKLESRIVKAKKCREYRVKMSQRATVQEPCLDCLKKMNGNRKLFGVIQQLWERLSMREKVGMGEEVFGLGESFGSLQ